MNKLNIYIIHFFLAEALEIHLEMFLNKENK